MLARPIGPRYDKFPCYTQPKLNGVRALYQSGVLQSRDEHLFSYPVVRHIIDELTSLKLGNLMLDGELYVHGWRLQKINGAVATNRTSPRDDSHLIEFHVFDIIDDRGFKCPFSERALDRHTMLDNCKVVKGVSTMIAYNREQLDQQFRHWCSLGYEGLMARPDGPYQIGETSHGTTFRSPFLWKYKSWKDAEYKCVGVTQGEGKADIGIGALTLIVNDDPDPENRSHFQCGTGFTDDERRELSLNPPIGKFVKVRFVETTSDGIPYPCAFLAVLS